MKTFGNLFTAVAFCVAVLALTFASAPVPAANSCSGQYGVCFSMCEKYGFGRHRADNPHPQSPEACRNHCIGWKNECMHTGCWSGDLHQACGLAKR